MNLSFTKAFSLIILFAFSTPNFAQVKKENKLLIGRLALSNHQYQSALENFSAIIKKDSTNYEPLLLKRSYQVRTW